MNHRISGFALSISIALSLACGADGPVSVDSDRVPASEEPAEAAPHGMSGPYATIQWAAQGGACHFRVVNVGGTGAGSYPVHDLGAVPGDCTNPGVTITPTNVLSWTAHGAVLLDRKTSTSTSVTPPTGDWESEGFGLDKDKVVAEARYIGPDNLEEAVHHWSVDGKTATFDEGAEQGAVGVTPCGKFAWDGSAWHLTSLDAMGLAEGTSPPFCANFDQAGTESAVAMPSSGGPGVFLDCTKQHDPPPAPGKGWCDFPDGPFLGGGSEVLEGQYTETPLVYAPEDGVWSVVSGFEHPGDQVSVLVSGDVAIACTDKTGVVLDLADRAQPLFVGVGCLTFWPADAGPIPGK